MTPTKLLIGQILVVLAIVLAGVWIATQWCAAMLGYQTELGVAWFEVGGVPVYRPWAIFWWWYSFDAYAPHVFDKAGALAGALGVATEQRSMRNYAGHRLAPWLAHVMVSRQETARPLLTQGEVMQLPPADELVLVSGMAPIRARKLRYYEDRNFRGRVVPPPALGTGDYADRPAPRADDWSGLVREADDRLAGDGRAGADDDGGLEQQRHPAIEEPAPVSARAQQLELPDLERDDPDAAADKRVMDRVRATIVRGHAINQAQSQDLLPGL
ncbi:type IV secretory system conjugative DNA transfer family protein [Sphingopyxis sp. DBS4]|uniref:type IV secretory system conjugative DNA transfer family protein n=1 Tax=Sphingopyxis sp. DBS4 TaxID=2968500 RepID=UPI0027D7BCEF|nr:type IV secretory system conjugative DNA transfer family protein [Sphingopyxis sp. DBS4]